MLDRIGPALYCRCLGPLWNRRELGAGAASSPRWVLCCTMQWQMQSGSPEGKYMLGAVLVEAANLSMWQRSGIDHGILHSCILWYRVASVSGAVQGQADEVSSSPYLKAASYNVTAGDLS